MKQIRAFIVNHLWWMVLFIAVIMLSVHSLGVKRIVIDNTSLVLLVLILISPFVAAIKKIKIGEFEAEIESDEVKRITRQVEKSLPETIPKEVISTEIGVTATAIKTLGESDPVVALAKLRIELESRLRRLYQQLKSDSSPNKRYAALVYIIRNLASAEFFKPEFGNALRDVITICNRAIHGEDIRDVDARLIIDKGIDLLEVLDRKVRDYGIVGPVEITVISLNERDVFQNGRYRLTTIVPLVDEPKKNVYILTQKELDTFFDGYTEFAEFVVSLEKMI